MRVLIAAIIGMVLAATGAQAGCGTWDAVRAFLGRDYGEAEIAVGVTRDGGSVAFTAGASGTWSLVSIGPDGTACIVAWGSSWAAVPYDTHPDDEDS